MSDQLRLPCRESETPDDWFIGRDGKQYPSDELLSHAEQQAILDKIVEERGGAGVHDGSILEDAQKALERAEADAKTAALGRRRRAKVACLDCAFRTRCLQQAIDNDEQVGTWGGYYEEEIRTIRIEINNRRRARH